MVGLARYFRRCPIYFKQLFQVNEIQLTRLHYLLRKPTTLLGKNCRTKQFVGRNFRHQTKNSPHSPDKKFRPIKVKVSLEKVQVNLRGKQDI